MPNYLKHLIRIGLFPYIIFIINYSTGNLFPVEYLNYQMDIPLHILGGMATALSIDYAWQLLQKRKTVTVSNLLIKWIMISAMVMAVAVIWEFYEFTSDVFWGTHHQPSNADTMKDLFDGMTGAIVTCLLFIRNRK